MEKISYTLEQITKISQLLDTIEVKGRRNLNAIESIFRLLESGLPIAEESEE